MSYQYSPLGGGIPKGAGINQRATVRYQCAPATTGRVMVSDDHEFQRAWVQDISVKGVGLLLAKCVKPGSFLVIQIKSTVRQKTYELPARVVHSTALSGGDWLVGCEFTGKLTEEDLDELL